VSNPNYPSLAAGMARNGGNFDSDGRSDEIDPRLIHGAARVLPLRFRVVELAFDDAGAGPCVVLIHGHPFDRSLWRPQAKALGREFRMVVPDLRGFGESPVTPHLVTLREYAEDVEELLVRLGVERAAVVGLSMGGLVAMDLATTHPERWWALGLVTTTAQPVTPQERALRNERADLVERDGMKVLIDYMHTGLYGPNAEPEVRSRVDAMMARAPVKGAAAALRGRAQRPDYRPRLRELDIPTFVCTGSEDPWSNETVTAEIVDHLRHPELLVVEGAGHLPNLEAEDVFNTSLTEFLTRHTPR
jgi:3-oxoadipate enol-lactonase